jgi:hypothetical protein
MTPSNPVPDDTARYDTDPAALAWARTRVQHQLDRLARFEEQATQAGRHEQARGLAIARRSTQQLLLGGEGCVVGAFDARRPAMFGGQPADDAAHEEQSEPSPDDTCRVVEVDGEQVRVRGSGDMSDESRTAIASLVGAARRRHQAEQARHDDQVRAGALREAADALDLDADHCGPDYDGTHGLRIAADRLRARADEISGKSAPAGGEQA